MARKQNGQVADEDRPYKLHDDINNQEDQDELKRRWKDMEVILQNRRGHGHCNLFGTRIYKDSLSFGFENCDFVVDQGVVCECARPRAGDFSSHKSGGCIHLSVHYDGALCLCKHQSLGDCLPNFFYCCCNSQI